ncbi:MAG: prolyl oligopeptidase family serine peptidase [Candidatus Krumholzibacteriota bacterium]|nr:prolyl oligopeptidase family serine peptidase [Candidatus Krumholzibacteriota bacterium]
MRKSLLLLLVLALLAGGAVAEELKYLDKLPPIIDREVFFGDPEITRGQISPDGKFISFLKTYKGQLNIWVKGVDEPFDAARPMSADTNRPVIRYGWSQDGKYLLYIQDKGGDENFHAYIIDPTETLEEGEDVPEARDITPIDGIRVTFYSFPEKTPDIIYLGLNDRDERYHDVYRVSISTGERELVWENTEGMSGFIFDLDGTLRMATRETDDGGTEFFRVEGKDIISVYTVTNEENANIISFHKNGKRAYMVTNKGEENDLTSLVLFDPQTGQTEVVETDPKNEVDFGGALFSNVTKELIATTYEADRLRIYWKDDKFEDAYKKLKKNLKKEIGDGDLFFGSSTNDDRYYIVVVTSDINPGAAYFYDMETGKTEFLYKPRPNLPSEHLAQMQPIKYKSRDGLTIHGYLTVPKGIKAKNLPVVVNPHGGPWARDSWGYNPEAQFLANRGYAVLQMNFRSSTGYGKAFFNAGKRKWGDEMQNDITDGVKYLIDKGIADPDKVSIYGGSYGGYATLAGLAFTPDLYCCGVDYVGVSNLLTLLKSIPPYWETARKFFDEHVGNPENPEDMERLKRQSPLFSADKITAPLLVVQGANDPRCKVPEAEQIVVAMRDLDRDVEYLCAPDEGHGFLGRENRTAFRVAQEKFFAKHLGGRYQESVKEDVQASLDEMWVPIESVKLEEPAGDMEAAKTAPLPKVNTSHLKAGTFKYTAKVAIQGQEIPVDVTVELSPARREARKVWRLKTEQSSMMGSALDTFEVDSHSLFPVYRGIKQGATTISINYSENSISGVINAGGREMPVTTKLEAPIFGSDAALDLVICSLPLKPGYKTTFRTFDLMSQAVNPMSLEVTGIENVTVPAGSFEAFKIEVRRMDGDPGGGTMYVSTDADHHLVRSVMQLPPASGGGTVTSELTATE